MAITPGLSPGSKIINKFWSGTSGQIVPKDKADRIDEGLMKFQNNKKLPGYKLAGS